MARTTHISARKIGSEPPTFAKADDGASAVEFALVTPIFLLFVMGVIEFGLIFFSYNSALNVARDTARQLATNRLAATDAPSIAKAAMPTWIQKNANLNVVVGQTTPTTQSTNIFTVTISFPASIATPVHFLSSFYSAFNLTAKVSMQQEEKS